MKPAKAIYRGTNRLSFRLPAWSQRLLGRNDGLSLPFTGRWGTRQYVHPDLLQGPQGLVLAATAYPYGSELYEVPEVFTLDAQGNWKPRLRLPMPGLVERQRLHYSDPELVLLGDEVVLYYRSCSRDRWLEKGREAQGDRLFAVGLAGNSEPRLVLEGQHGGLISPAIFPWQGGYCLVCVDISGRASRLRRYVSADAYHFEELGEPRLLGHKVWHLDIAWIQGRLLGAFLVVEDKGPQLTRLVLAESLDGGLGWTKVSDLDFVEPGIKRSYRASLCEAGGEILLALSYETTEGLWGLGLRTLEPQGQGYRIGPKKETSCT